MYVFLLVIQDPKMYVQTILDVHKKYNALVMSAFNNDAGFVAALDKVTCDWITLRPHTLQTLKFSFMTMENLKR